MYEPCRPYTFFLLYSLICKVSIKLLCNYVTKEFETNDPATDYITTEMNKQNLSYTLVFDHTEGDVRVIVFQYYTLYMETFIIHKQFDIRRF